MCYRLVSLPGLNSWHHSDSDPLGLGKVMHLVLINELWEKTCNHPWETFQESPSLCHSSQQCWWWQVHQPELWDEGT